MKIDDCYTEKETIEDPPLYSFNVTWEIPIEAASPIEAAKLARDILLDPENIASFFSVTDTSGKRFNIDAITGQTFKS